MNQIACHVGGDVFVPVFRGVPVAIRVAGFNGAISDFLLELTLLP